MKLPTLPVRLLIGFVVATAFYIFFRYTIEMNMYAQWLIGIFTYVFILVLAWKPKWIPDVIASMFYG